MAHACVFGEGPDESLLEAPWVWPATRPGSMRASCELQPVGPWNVSNVDMPSAVLAASRAVNSSSAARLYSFLEKLGSDDCCTSVLVLGGSVPCGHGAPGCGGAKTVFTNATGAGGQRGAWPTWFHRWLNWSHTDCCPSGHIVRNLCVGATGIDYVLETFATRVLPALASVPTQLVVIDTAVNDYNEYLFAKRCQWRRCITMDERKRKQHETQAATEALVRRLLMLNLSVAFVENARFRGAISDTTYGAWTSHEPVLRHYGIPTVHLGLAAEAADRENLPRPDLWAREWTHVDGQHLSAAGHWQLAMLLTRGVLCHEWESYHVSQHHSPLPHPYCPEEQLEPYLGGQSVPKTLVDFTDPKGSWRRFVVPPKAPAGSGSPVDHVWAWTMAVKQASGGYSLLRAEDATAEEVGKLSFSVRADAPRSFEAAVSFKTGRLRVGYLRSFEGQASVHIQVIIPADDKALRYNASWVVNGTWDAPVSVYTSDEFQLPESLQRVIWPARCGWFKRGRCERWANMTVDQRYPVGARIRFTSIPRALEAVDGRRLDSSQEQSLDSIERLVRERLSAEEIRLLHERLRETGGVGGGSGGGGGGGAGRSAKSTARLPSSSSAVHARASSTPSPTVSPTTSRTISWAPFSLYTLSSY